MWFVVVVVSVDSARIRGVTYRSPPIGSYFRHVAPSLFPEHFRLLRCFAVPAYTHLLLSGNFVVCDKRSFIYTKHYITCCRHSLHDNKKVCVNRRASFRSAGRNIREIVLMVTDLPQGSRALCL